MADRKLMQDQQEVRPKMLSVWINNFQYNDKISLIKALRDDDMHVPFAIAVQQFVDEFEQFNSPGAPYPKRIGRWVGLYAPGPVMSRLISWANTEAQNPLAVRYRIEFREALETAMNIDRTTRPRLEVAA